MKKKVITLGEVLIDFLALTANATVGYCERFEKNPGGAPANVAVGLSRLGLASRFIGAVGNDEFGRFLREQLRKYKVDTKYMKLCDNANTTLAFISQANARNRSFCFYRNPGADTLLSKDDIECSYFKNVSLFHFGSLSLTNEPSYSATYKAVDISRTNNLIVSYDPNLRLALWKNKKIARSTIMRAVPYCDILKITDDEGKFLTGEGKLEKLAVKLSSYGPKLIFITRGEKGSFAYFKGRTAFKPAFKVKVVDATGAGDAFTSAAIFQILEKAGNAAEFSKIEKLELDEILTFANAAAGLCVTKKGVIPAMPSHKEVNAFLARLR